MANKIVANHPTCPISGIHRSRNLSIVFIKARYCLPMALQDLCSNLGYLCPCDYCREKGKIPIVLCRTIPTAKVRVSPGHIGDPGMPDASCPRKVSLGPGCMPKNDGFVPSIMRRRIFFSSTIKERPNFCIMDSSASVPETSSFVYNRALFSLSPSICTKPLF